MPLRTGEEQNQNTDTSDETTEDQTSSADTATNQQTDPATDDNTEYYRLLETTATNSLQAMRDLQEQNRRLQEQLSGIETRMKETTPTTPPAPTRTPEEEREAFFNNPREAMRGLIKEELAATVAPLQQEVRSLLTDRVSSSLLSKFENHPKIAPHIKDTLIRKHVERALQQAANSGVTLTEQHAMAAVVQVVGLKNMGMLDSIDGITSSSDTPPANNERGAPSPTNNSAPLPANSTPANRSSVPTPPHLRPTPPAGPRNQGNASDKKPWRELDANEKILAKKSGLSDYEYLELQERVSPRDVANWNGDGKVGGTR
jgi:hypothetical protein